MSTSTLAAPTQNQQINNDLYVGKGFLPNIQQAVSFGVAQFTADGEGYRVIIPAGYGGTDTIAAVVNGNVNVSLEDHRNPNPTYYQWNGTTYAGPSFYAGDLTADDASLTTCEVASSPVRTFANTPDAPAAPTYPPAGIGISTGTAWGATSIDPATVPLLDAGENLPIPAGNVLIGGTNLAITGTAPPSRLGGLLLAWNATTQFGSEEEADFINVSPANAVNGGFKWWNVAPGTVIDNTVTAIMAVDKTGLLTVQKANVASDMTVSGIFSATGYQPGSLTTKQGLNVAWNLSGGSAETDFINGGASGFRWYNSAVGGVINSGTAPIATLDQAGDLAVVGNLSAATKSFKIVHPQDSSKYLIHACLEGPENGVYYRGEGQTGEDGVATITLPDYFEALTAKTGRTVQLTELIEDDETEIGKLAASRVKDGKFSVRSEYTSQRFYWEVKAVRADVDPLIITADI